MKLIWPFILMFIGVALFSVYQYARINQTAQTVMLCVLILGSYGVGYFQGKCGSCRFCKPIMKLKMEMLNLYRTIGKDLTITLASTTNALKDFNKAAKSGLSELERR